MKKYIPTFVNRHLVPGALGRFEGAHEKRPYAFPVRGVVLNTYGAEENQEVDSVSVDKTVRCDVLIYGGPPGTRVGFLPNVLVAQDYAGVHTGVRWAPTPSTRSPIGGLKGINPGDLDGDHVLVMFVNGDPLLPVIVKNLPHPSVDLGQEALSSDHRYDITNSRVDSAQHLQNYYGATWGVVNGNFIIDVTRAHVRDLTPSGEQPALPDDPVSRTSTLSDALGIDGNANVFLRDGKHFSVTVQENPASEHAVVSVAIAPTATFSANAFLVVRVGGTSVQVQASDPPEDNATLMTSLARALETALTGTFTVILSGTTIWIYRANGDLDPFLAYASPNLTVTRNTNANNPGRGTYGSLKITRDLFSAVVNGNSPNNQDDPGQLVFGLDEVLGALVMSGVSQNDYVADTNRRWPGTKDFWLSANEALLRTNKVRLGHDEEADGDGSVHEPVIKGTTFTEGLKDHQVVINGLLNAMQNTLTALAGAMAALVGALGGNPSIETAAAAAATAAQAQAQQALSLANSAAQLYNDNVTNETQTFHETTIPAALSNDVTTR